VHAKNCLRMREQSLVAKQSFTGQDTPAVLRMNTLFYSHPGSAQVSFTRSPEVAAYWTLLERDNDEGKGAILVFNRSKLRNRYRLDPYHDPIWDSPSVDEMEEWVSSRDIHDVRRYLVGVVMVGSKKRTSPEKQRRNRSFQKRLALRSEGIEPELAFEMVKGRRQTLDDLEPILNVGLSNFAMKLKTGKWPRPSEYEEQDPATRLPNCPISPTIALRKEPLPSVKRRTRSR
jgi:hypothetical protein